MKASLLNYEQSPRKVRLLADLVKGKSVDEALTILHFTDRKATESVGKLISSAAANATANFNIPRTDLVVKDLKIDKGLVLKRVQPRARGAAFVIRRRRSHIEVVLGQKDVDNKKGLKKAKDSEVKEEVKAEAPEKKTTKTVAKKETKKSKE